MMKYCEKQPFWEDVPETNSIPRNRALLDRDLKTASVTILEALKFNFENFTLEKKK